MIIRAKRRQNFTVINNAVLADTRLSFRAKGVLVFVLAKPDDWAISERSLAQEGPDGRSAVASALTELEAAGYLQRRRVRNADGTLGWDNTVFDEPQAVTDLPEISDEIIPEIGEEPMPEIAGVDHSDPGGGSQRSTVAGKTGHGFTVHGKSGHIIRTEQLRTNTSSTVVEEGDAPAPAAEIVPPSAWWEPEPTVPAIPEPAVPTGTVKTLAQQPVIAMYRDAFMRYPAKHQMQWLMAQEITDLRRWREVLDLWISKTWALTNLAGMVDLYRNPERIRELTSYRPTSPAPVRTASPARTERVAPGWDEWLAELNPEGARTS